MVNSVVLPAHAVTSGFRFPTELAGVWIARYTSRSVFFRLTISAEGSAAIFQEITTVFGIPVFRADRLELDFFSPASREMRWRSSLTEITATYNSAFTQIEGVEQVANRAPASFIATPL